MCGIWGVNWRDGGRSVPMELLGAMGDAMPYRGPDDRGSYSVPGLGLGHLRLSILDLSPAGHQPMSTDDGRYTIVFNGEIYNFIELRTELEAEGVSFRSQSDTEVILHLYRKLGPACVDKFNGMFAMAIWDAVERTLWLARDRIGIKPLYYVLDGEKVVFASEIKAIVASGLVEREPNRRAIYQYFQHMFTTGAETFFSGVKRLLPGYWLLVRPDDHRLVRYWDVPLDSEPDISAPIGDYAARLREIIDDSVRLRLRSDVPVGAYLSGGIDSSSIVSLAQPRLGKMSTFSLAFDEGPEYDEREFVAKVRERYDTEHFEIVPGMEECWRALPEVVWWMDEPTVSAPTVSQYFLSKVAKEHVTVVLGGQGGDELLGGYYRFFPRYLKSVLEGAVRGKRSIGDILTTARNLLGHMRIVGFRRVGQKMGRYTAMMKMLDPTLLEHAHDTRAELMQDLPLADPMNRMLYWEIKNYLPGLLHAEDRMSMAVSLESRVPLLDHRMVEFAATIPPELKMRHLVTKFIERESMRGVVPDSILDRKDKRGTPSPLPKWFGGGLSDRVRSVLTDRRATERGIFDPALVERAMSQHTRGNGNYGDQIWMLLSVELWHRTFIDGPTYGPVTL
jgi:asparagine synthase (glutamine-hydrolysing)